ncbi:MAG: head-tail connector protein [Peptostreptococcaceae bacterium]
MKVSEITAKELQDYLSLDESEPILTVLLQSAKAYIKSYTGLTDAEVDTHEDLVPVIYVLVADGYENREYSVKNDKVNRMTQSTLDLYCKNLL